MKIAMIGAGYVGLTTSAGLAAIGHKVACHDIDSGRMAELEAGRLPIYEPDLEGMVASLRQRGRLAFCHGLKECVADADAVFLAVGTPSRADGGIDLSYIEAAARQIAPHVKAGAVVVVKSTVVVGTNQRLRALMTKVRGRRDFGMASNPEFLREGRAVADFMQPERIVIGTDDDHSEAVLRRLYATFINNGVRIVATSTANAELIKYGANAFLALKIGFINEVAELCEKAGGDVSAVAEGIGLDSRIGPAFLAPGPGFGGSCFPKDTRAFSETGRRYGAPQRLIETLLVRNDERKVALARKIIEEGSLRRGQTVAVLGVAFKADTDDVREAAALTIIPILQQAGLAVRAHDPKAAANAQAHLPGVSWHETPYVACRDADAVVVLTEWAEYRTLHLARVAAVMAGAVLFDYRNLFSPADVTASGLRHVALGRLPRAPMQERRSVRGGTVAALEAAAASSQAS